MPHIQVRRRSEGRWLVEDLVGPDAVLELSTVDARIPLSAVYESVSFEDPAGSGL